MKVLVKKTFHFVDDVWRACICWKITDLRYVVSGCLIQLRIVKYILGIGGGSILKVRGPKVL